jgi:hypothetical protein
LYNNHIYNDDFSKPFTEGGMAGHVDLPRLKQGKVGGAFWSAFVPCPANGTDFSDSVYAPSKTIYLLHYPSSSTVQLLQVVIDIFISRFDLTKFDLVTMVI